MGGFGVVFLKELLDNARDKRTLFSSFSVSILGPIFTDLGVHPVHFAIIMFDTRFIRRRKERDMPNPS